MLGNLVHKYLMAGARWLRPLTYIMALFIFGGGLMSETYGQTMNAPGAGHGGHMATDGAGPAPNAKSGTFKIGAGKIAIPDPVVLDQDGKEVRFYSELIKDKVVVLGFFFTSCVEYCPLIGASLSRLQSELGERLGKDVFLILVSKDPDVDTPEKIKAWGKKFSRRDGWTLLTGAGVKEILAKTVGQNLGQDLHLPPLLIGNDKTGEWRSYPALADSRELLSLINKTAEPAR